MDTERKRQTDGEMGGRQSGIPARVAASAPPASASASLALVTRLSSFVLQAVSLPHPILLLQLLLLLAPRKGIRRHGSVTQCRVRCGPAAAEAEQAAAAEAAASSDAGAGSERASVDRVRSSRSARTIRYRPNDTRPANRVVVGVAPHCRRDTSFRRVRCTGGQTAAAQRLDVRHTRPGRRRPQDVIQRQEYIRVTIISSRRRRQLQQQPRRLKSRRNRSASAGIDAAAASNRHRLGAAAAAAAAAPSTVRRSPTSGPSSSVDVDADRTTSQ